jgi:hypothetical protein
MAKFGSCLSHFVSGLNAKAEGRLGRYSAQNLSYLCSACVGSYSGFRLDPKLLQNLPSCTCMRRSVNISGVLESTLICSLAGTRCMRGNVSSTRLLGRNGRRSSCLDKWLLVDSVSDVCIIAVTVKIPVQDV